MSALRSSLPQPNGGARRRHCTAKNRRRTAKVLQSHQAAAIRFHWAQLTGAHRPRSTAPASQTRKRVHLKVVASDIAGLQLESVGRVPEGLRPELVELFR